MMSVEEATRYSAIVARGNLLVSDRPDLRFTAKAASRWMARPCYDDLEKVAGIAKSFTVTILAQCLTNLVELPRAISGRLGQPPQWLYRARPGLCPGRSRRRPSIGRRGLR